MIVARAIVRAAAWAAGLFYRVERVGADLPPGPSLIVANHANMLMDPLLALWLARRPVRVLAKFPLFRIPVFGHVLRGVDTLPVYRHQDDPALLARNKATFEATIEALRAGETVLMFPEGGSHNEPALLPLKAGTARLALTAEDKSDWKLGLAVVPLGLTYHRKHLFRSRVVASVGEPIPVARWHDAHGADRVVAIRALTDAIAEALEQLTLNLAAESDRELIETADLLYARAKAWVGWREREALRERLPRLQRLARGLARLRTSDAEGFERLARSLREYRARLRRLGAGDGGVPPRYGFRRAVRDLVREGVVLGRVFPLAAVGTIAWYLPYATSGIIARLMNPQRETIATVKLLTGIIAYPAMYTGWIAVAAWLGGALAAVLATVALPPLALLVIHWHDRRREAWEDIRALWRAARHPGERDRLAELRDVLAIELDALALKLSAERAEGPAARRPVA